MARTFVRAEAEALQRLDEAADRVLHAHDWRGRLDGGADGGGSGPNLGLPVADGVGADEERGRGLGSGPAEEALQFENPEALGGRVVGPPAFRDLAEPRTEQLDDVPREAGLEFGLLQSGAESAQRIVLGAGVA